MKNEYKNKEIKISGVLIKVWTVFISNQDEHKEILGIFPSQFQADGFKEELSAKDKKITKILSQYAIKYEDDTVSLFDPNLTYFKYQLNIDYEPEIVKHEKEIRKNALAKLTEEEKTILGL